MTLGELVRQLDQHGVFLTLTPEGKIRPTADQPPPAELIAAIKANRVELVRHLERLEDQGAAMPEHGGAQAAVPTVTPPRLGAAAQAEWAGHCGTCRHFTPDLSEGRYMGVCGMGWAAHYPAERNVRHPVVIHEGAACMTADAPRWIAKAAPRSERGAA